MNWERQRQHSRRHTAWLHGGSRTERSTAQRLGGDAEEYASRAEVIARLWSDIIAENPELYGTPGDLDDLVHDAYSKQASEVNNGGLGSLVRFLIESYGTGGARSLLSDLRPAAAGLRSRRYSRACGRCGAAPAVGSQPLAPAASPAARPGRPASAAGGPACFHAGGRVKPTTGDSPRLEPGSP